MSDLLDILKEWNPRYMSAKNEYRIQCPYRENHNALSDGSKSGFLIPDKNIYHCFSCGITVNAVVFLTTQCKVGFNEAFSLVAVDNIDYLINGKATSQPTTLDMIIPMQPPQSFIDRGFSQRLLKHFKVGSEKDVTYIPITDNYNASDIKGIKFRKGREFWYKPDNFPKELYLYNFSACVGQKFCILVEGETDVYRSCLHGIWNVCALSGGVLTDEQAKLIVKENFHHVITAFDNDKAGFKNTEIAHLKLRQYVKHFVAFYDAEDPDKCSSEMWHHAINTAEDYAAYHLGMTMEMGEEYINLVDFVNRTH